MMSNRLAIAKDAARQDSAGAASRVRRAPPDIRRRLQLALAAIWLLDGVLQCQPAMFTRAFPQMLAAAAAGNPPLIADPITWSAHLIAQHVVVMNAGFAAIQLLLGLGMVWRPTVKLALGASIGWALAVWWLGEGLGSVLTGGASPVNGAPGAVLLYALLAILLWPIANDRPAPFVAGRTIGTLAARGIWLIVWGSLAGLAIEPAARAPQAISGMISDMAPGEPGWLAWTVSHAASALSHRGLPASVLLAAVLAVVAAAACLPGRPPRAAVALAIVIAAVIWVAEGLGGILTGSGTDPNSGPLLALFALSYWPTAHRLPSSEQGDRPRWQQSC
jgi:hypothetical protein